MTLARNQLPLDYAPPRDNGEPPTRAHFDGSTYVASRDQRPLNRQTMATWKVLMTGRVYTLSELTQAVANELGEPVSETSVSARFRDLKKERFGAWPAKSDCVPGTRRWVYWMAMDELTELQRRSLERKGA